jgi:hypothetical protein
MNDATERADRNLLHFNRIRNRDFHFEEVVRHLKQARKYSEGFRRKTIEAAIQIVESLKRDDLNAWLGTEEMVQNALECWFEKKIAEKQQRENGESK